MKYLTVILLAMPLMAGAGSRELLLTDTYSVMFTDRPGQITVSRPEFLLLQALQTRQRTTLTLKTLARRTGSEDIKGLIQRLNLSAQVVLKTPLIEVSSKGEVALVGELQQTHGVPFAYHTTGMGVIYRGEVVDLSPKQMDLVRYLFDRPEHHATYDEINTIMGWSNPKMRAHEYMETINRRTLAATGARLIDVYQNEGLSIKFVERPARDLPERIERVRESLDLSEDKYELQIDERAFVRIGLPVAELKEALQSLRWENGREIESFRITVGDKVLSSYVHNEKSAAELTWQPKPSRRDCGSFL